MTTKTICAVVIARNEERDLPKCLASLKDVADKLVVVDTGSTDDTRKVARKHGAAVHTYLDACEPDPNNEGEVRIVDFSKARNHALDLASEAGCDYILWMDADDTVRSPKVLRRAIYGPKAIYGCWIYLGTSGQRQLHHRLIPSDWKDVRFKGWCHEYLQMREYPVSIVDKSDIYHDATPHATAGEDSNARNLRILLKQWEAEPDARCAFYLANTHKDGGRYAEAIPWYEKRRAYGHEFVDEYLFAMLYQARCHSNLKQYAQADALCVEALKLVPDWMEFQTLRAYIAVQEGRWLDATTLAEVAVDKPTPPTTLWRESNCYRDQPARLSSFAWERLGDQGRALAWALRAKELIGVEDKEWQGRIDALALAMRKPPVVHPGRDAIALYRPGAIGDVLMTLNLIPALREAHPDTDIHYYTQVDGLQPWILAAGCDKVLRCDELLDESQYRRVIKLVGYPLKEGYPEKAMKLHLLHYFADEMGLPAHMPQLVLPLPDRPLAAPNFGDYATLQWKTGWSRYKEWPKERWEEVCRRLPFPVIIVDEQRTPTLSEAISLIANARLHLGVDSFGNHLTNYLWRESGGKVRRVPGVILWGSTQWEAAGYPDNVNICHRLPCGPCFREDPKISQMPRGPCIDIAESGVHRCMDTITVEEVVAAAIEQWHPWKAATALETVAA